MVISDAATPGGCSLPEFTAPRFVRTVDSALVVHAPVSVDLAAMFFVVLLTCWQKPVRIPLPYLDRPAAAVKDQLDVCVC